MKLSFFFPFQFRCVKMAVVHDIAEGTLLLFLFYIYVLKFDELRCIMSVE